MSSITKTEYKTITGLAAIFSLRMLGLFMILPVFSVYANQLNYVTPTRIGIALGIYGLTQALLQIPFGFVSDWLGRKPIILFGLVLFSAGSVTAAISDSIFGVIIGRALQGAGAVGCVIMALATDLTREEVRIRAMAVIGVTIGLSFALAMILGPVLDQHIGVTGIFWLSAFFAVIAIVVLFIWIPSPNLEPNLAPNLGPNQNSKQNSTVLRGSASTEETSIHLPTMTSIPKVFKDSNLVRLNLGILILHASLTALF